MIVIIKDKNDIITEVYENVKNVKLEKTEEHNATNPKYWTHDYRLYFNDDVEVSKRTPLIKDVYKLEIK